MGGVMGRGGWLYNVSILDRAIIPPYPEYFPPAHGNILYLFLNLPPHDLAQDWSHRSRDQTQCFGINTLPWAVYWLQDLALTHYLRIVKSANTERLSVASASLTWLSSAVSRININHVSEACQIKKASPLFGLFSGLRKFKKGICDLELTIFRSIITSWLVLPLFIKSLAPRRLLHEISTI